MSFISDAKSGSLPGGLIARARSEGIDHENLARGLASGRIVALKNAVHGIDPVIVGEGARVKVNANIGMSPDVADEDREVEKAKTAIKAGADAVMDLSIGGDTWGLLKRLLRMEVPLGTVPVYQAALESVKKHGSVLDLDSDQLWSVIERQTKAGVDFMTVHSGITRKTLEAVDSSNRVTGIVSRGGSLLAKWMQIEELLVLGRLVEQCWDGGVGVMVEGPGHVPLNEIGANILLQKRICNGAPFYVLGPIVTDIAAGYDHIAGAIGGAVAAMHGADFLCYVTPSEHLALPNDEDVKNGVIASKIAAHAADLSRGIDSDHDLNAAKARAKLDWDGLFKQLLDPETACAVRAERHPSDPRVCTMCGEFCSMRE
jgi:phosphomethylpyrimidine synthase